MAPRATQVNNGQPKETTIPQAPIEQVAGPPNRGFTVTKIRKDTLALLERICEALRKKAESGLPIPVRVELGKNHVLDQALRRMAKEIGVV